MADGGGARARRGAHVVILDDSPDLAAVLTDLLKEEGYRVTPSPSMVAVHDLAAMRPDVLVLDWMFGAESLGVQLQALWLEQALACVPIVVCTAAERVMQ